jgi:Bacterial SH3 domain
MAEENAPTLNASSSTIKKNDKIEVVKVLILAVVSFVLGFGLVIAFLKPSSPSVNLNTGGNASPKDNLPSESSGGDTSQAPTRYAPTPQEPATETGYAPSGDATNAAEPGDEAVQIDEGNALPEVPPGRTPPGISIEGEAFYLKCWDENGSEFAGGTCDRLPILEKRFSTRLYVVSKCKEQYTDAKTSGKLSLGMEVDFYKNTLRFWNGASSELENASRIGSCIRTELAGLPISKVEHKYSRYRIFFTLVFGDGTKPSSPAPAATSATPRSKGRLVNVILDHVRVRKSPVDGAIIGKINSGNQVTLIGKKAAWCHIITPNNNEGWMTCEALKK